MLAHTGSVSRKDPFPSRSHRFEAPPSNLRSRCVDQESNFGGSPGASFGFLYDAAVQDQLPDSDQPDHLKARVEASNDPASRDPGSRSPNSDVTQLLARAQSGETGAVEQLLPMVYGELRGLARAIFRDQNQSHTLQPTALVHEAFMKLAGKLEGVEGKRHFFLVAGRAMRQILTDHARAKNAAKRGGQGQRVTLHPDMAENIEASLT